MTTNANVQYRIDVAPTVGPERYQRLVSKYPGLLGQVHETAEEAGIAICTYAEGAVEAQDSDVIQVYAMRRTGNQL